MIDGEDTDRWRVLQKRGRGRIAAILMILTMVASGHGAGADGTVAYKSGDGGASGSQVAVTASNRLVLSLNPYRDVDWNTFGRHKGNLHTHTTNSDGRSTVDAVIDAYKKLGYDVLAITDHSQNTWTWKAYGRNPATLGMLAVSGNELSRHNHVGSLFSSYTTASTNIETAIQGVAGRQGVAIVNHPAYHWFRHSRKNPPVEPDVKIPMKPAMRALTQSDFSIETWFRVADTNRYVLMGNYSTTASGALNLELPGDNRVRVYLQPVSGGKIVDLNLPADKLGTNTRDDNWHHLAAVRKDGDVLLYLDGRLAGRTANTAGSFALQGDAWYLGRDGRTGEDLLNGGLDNVRFWMRGLSAAEVAAFAAGASRAAGETAMLAEYGFETSGGSPVVPSGLFRGRVDDTAGHASGSFHGMASGAEALALEGDAPAVLRVSGASRHALRFKASGVPSAVVSDYADLFQRYPVLAGMEVLNGTTETHYGLDRDLWDRLLTALMPQRPVWGLATDDLHVFADELGRDWCVFLTSRLDEISISRALKNGAFYFSTTHLLPVATVTRAQPPRIERITHDARAGRLTILATSEGRPLPEGAYTWVANGATVHTGSTLSYRTTQGIGYYVRAEIRGPGGLTLTNPFGFTAISHQLD